LGIAQELGFYPEESLSEPRQSLLAFLFLLSYLLGYLRGGGMGALIKKNLGDKNKKGRN